MYPSFSFPPRLEMIAAADAVAGAGTGSRPLDGAFGPGDRGAGWGVGATVAGALSGAVAVFSSPSDFQGEVPR